MCKSIFISIILTCFFSCKAYPEVVINGTRIVFHAQDKESVIQLMNKGKKPYLVQMWLDDGNPKARPGEVNVPFIVNPPVIRIDPERGQAIRLMALNGHLPQDRESLFWFNLLEVPPKPTQRIQAGDNVLQMAFRTRIKLFYRPDNLVPSPLQAYKQLKVSLIGNKLTIINPSPYFITFSKLEVRHSKTSPVLSRVVNFTKTMVNPESEIEFSLKSTDNKDIRGEKLFYSIINDYGGESVNEQIL